MTGFIWSMYFRINNRLGLKFSKVAVKSLASAMLSNISQAAISVAGTVVLSSVLSLTGVGGVASSAIMAAMDYSIVMVGGIIYLKLLNKLMKAGASPDDMSATEMEIELDQVMRGENIASLLKEQKQNYKKGKKEGTITGKEFVDIVE